MVHLATSLLALVTGTATQYVDAFSLSPGSALAAAGRVPPALATARSVSRAGGSLTVEDGERSGVERKRSHVLLRASTEETTVDEEEKELEFEKLIYDPRSGRFFEKQIEEVCREEYCAIDEVTGNPVLLTKGEKERIFQDAIQSFYYSGRKLLEDDDFDKLKEDLLWEGSQVVLFSREETLFMNAMSAYLRGTPILSDEEFDKLKAQLREAGSPVAVSTEPKCYIDTGICTVTFQEDAFRRFTTYLPATFILGLAMLGISFEVVEPLRHINPLFTLALIVFPASYTSFKLTNAVLYQNDGLIASGPCPSCGVRNHVYFGGILGVEGFNAEAEFKCTGCGEEIKITKKDLRARTSPKI